MFQSRSTVPNDRSHNAGRLPVQRARMVDHCSLPIDQGVVLDLGDAAKPNWAMGFHRLPVSVRTR